MKHQDLIQSVPLGFYTEPVDFPTRVRNSSTLMAKLFGRGVPCIYAWRRYMFSDTTVRHVKYKYVPCPRWASALMALVAGQHPLYDLHWPALERAMAECDLPALAEDAQPAELQKWRADNQVDVALLLNALGWTNEAARRHTFSAVGKDPALWFVVQLAATGEARDWRGNVVATITRRVDETGRQVINPLAPSISGVISAPADTPAPSVTESISEVISNPTEESIS